jgi:DNA-binding NarL/FixJ family response regulator
MAGNYSWPRNDPGLMPLPINLTDRELLVIRLHCQEKTRKEIAAELGCSEALVKAIITTILNKTGFESILRLAIYLVSNGYLLPGIGM